MGLRDVAQRDLARVLESQEQGFAWPVVLIAPDGFSAPLKGITQDIGRTIDPDTGVAVSGRLASVTLRMATLIASGYTALPEGEVSSTSKPWRVEFTDVNASRTHTFKVVESYPDRTLGDVVLLLEAYKPR